ncbi:hypothetical protein CJU90_4654 [Yarrowia sp. C11]|nr:hypothetical protein CJU90_4654 [Yarrowia sp. C11]KAG5370594.1 hypothetical protein CKK34_0703 [Yarrowia sp. E02]
MADEGIKEDPIAVGDESMEVVVETGSSGGPLTLDDSHATDLATLPMGQEEVSERLESLHKTDMKIADMTETLSNAIDLLIPRSELDINSFELKEGDKGWEPGIQQGLPSLKSAFKVNSIEFLQSLEEVSTTLRKEIKRLNDFSRDKVLPINTDTKAQWTSLENYDKIINQIRGMLGETEDTEMKDV